MANKATTTILCLSLCGCAASTDPREGGLAGGLAGLGGAYDQRIQWRADSVQRLRMIQDELKAEQVQLTDERAYQEDRLAGLRRELRGLSGEIAKLKRQLSGKHSQLASERAQQRKLEHDLANLQQRIHRLDSRSTGAGADVDIVELEAQRDALDEEYRALLDIYLELGR